MDLLSSSGTSFQFRDERVLAREHTGVATVNLPLACEELHGRSFAAARRSFGRLCESSVACIPPNADSAHATGYHPAGGMSRYNAHREGFVFSDHQIIEVKGVPESQPIMMEFFHSLHAIAQQVLLAMERKSDFPVSWFQRFQSMACQTVC